MDTSFFVGSLLLDFFHDDTLLFLITFVFLGTPYDLLLPADGYLLLLSVLPIEGMFVVFTVSDGAAAAAFFAVYPDGVAEDVDALLGIP